MTKHEVQWTATALAKIAKKSSLILQIISVNCCLAPPVGIAIFHNNENTWIFKSSSFVKEPLDLTKVCRRAFIKAQHMNWTDFFDKTVSSLFSNPLQSLQMSIQQKSFGCGGMGESNHGCAADKSAAIPWCYQVRTKISEECFQLLVKSMIWRIKAVQKVKGSLNQCWKGVAKEVACEFCKQILH